MALSKSLLAVLSLWASTAVALLVVGGLCIAGCDSAENVSNPVGASGERIGQVPAQEVTEVAVEDLSEEMIGQTVQVEGTVTKQCPAVGCWLMVEGETGEVVFVDLNPAGLRLNNNREGERAEVIGPVAKQGGRLRIEAQSVQFGPDPRAAQEDPAPEQEL